MSLSRRGFLGWLGASTAAAGTALAVPTSPAPNQLVFSADLGGGLMEFTVDEPPSVVINREEYYSYTWDHVLGFLDKPDVLVKDTGEWGTWWRDKVCYDQRNQEVLIPKNYKGGKPFWSSSKPPEAVYSHEWEYFMPNVFIDRWLHMQAIHTGEFIQSEELKRAMFSNPNLYKLAERWKRKHA
jgi:hypothetical protein